MRRRRRQEPHENHDRWVVPYADFVTLLFAFFAVLYASSELDMTKRKQFEEAFKKYLIKYGAFGGEGKQIEIEQKYNSAIDHPIKTYPRKNQKLDKTEIVVTTLLEEQLSEQEFEESVQELTSETAGVRISLSSTTLFRGSSARFKRKSLSLLNRVGEVLKKTNKRIFIEGHTSDKSISTNSAYKTHWELSSMQATTVARHFIKVLKVDPQKILVLSYGKHRPVVPNDSQKNRKRNDRIDFLVLTEDLPI